MKQYLMVDGETFQTFLVKADRVESTDHSFIVKEYNGYVILHRYDFRCINEDKDYYLFKNMFGVNEQDAKHNFKQIYPNDTIDHVF